MKTSVKRGHTNVCLFAALLPVLLLAGARLHAQTCPSSATTTTITSFPNTYYPGQQALVSAGSTSVVIGAATHGSTPINIGDVLLIIQMQGAQINATNGSVYGDGVSGSGYLANSQLLAGNMEYVVATNAVPLSGGTLSLLAPTVNQYKSAAFTTDGQYTYQVIHVPAYYNLVLGATVTPPYWDGSTGGVIVLNVVNVLNMNGQTISASGAGFRGGAGVKITGGPDHNTDYASVSGTNANLGAGIGDHASKGEGIAGTPRLINSNNYGSFTINTAEGYFNGSFAMGAPGNAGGGGTDYLPATQNDNSGGGGGGNGGGGGKGGNSYSANQPVGGNPGAFFAQNSPIRLVMGGGGGAGDNNDGTGSLPYGFSASGATGGGIVIIYAQSIINAGIINVNGMSADSTEHNDGSGGGGAGGSVLLDAGSGQSNVTVFANGGDGGINDGAYGSTHYAHGPGGGGGGGVVYANGALNAASSAHGGPAGHTIATNLAVTNYGAAAGSSGILNTSATITPPMTCTILPMQFLSVDGRIDGTEVVIGWTVANEENVKNYLVERSYNGTDFSAAGTVDYKPGNAGGNSYSFRDASALKSSTISYRVEAQNNDGSYNFSKIVQIQTDAAAALSISPDPASASATILWLSAGNSNVLINLVDATGHLVLSRQYQLHSGTNELQLTKLANLTNGLYFVLGYDGADCRTGKLLIHH
ncbi:MAG TPA: hypothetical protein VNS58_19790 [Puia sp.]|nr:hypothetical protein [Puia sp.]